MDTDDLPLWVLKILTGIFKRYVSWVLMIFLMGIKDPHALCTVGIPQGYFIQGEAKLSKIELNTVVVSWL